MDIENRVDIMNETKHRTNRGVLFRYGVQLGVRWIPIPHIPTLFLKIQRYCYTITTKYEFFSKFWVQTDWWMWKEERIDEWI